MQSVSTFGHNTGTSIDLLSAACEEKQHTQLLNQIMQCNPLDGSLTALFDASQPPEQLACVELSIHL